MTVAALLPRPLAPARHRLKVRWCRQTPVSRVHRCAAGRPSFSSAIRLARLLAVSESSCCCSFIRGTRLRGTNGEVVVALHGLDDWYTTVVREQFVPRLFLLLCPSTSHAAQHAVRTTSRRTQAWSEERARTLHGPRTVVRTGRAYATAHGPPHQMLGPNAKCYGAAMVAADQMFAVARRKSAAHRRGVARQSRACAERARRVGSCGRKDAAGPRALAPAGTVRRARASIGEGAGG